MTNCLFQYASITINIKCTNWNWKKPKVHTVMFSQSYYFEKREILEGGCWDECECVCCAAKRFDWRIFHFVQPIGLFCRQMLSKLCAFAVFRFFLFSVPNKLILFAIGIVWRWWRCGEKKVEAFQSLSLEVRSCSSSGSCCCSCVQTDFSKTLRGAEGRKTETHTRVHFFYFFFRKLDFAKMQNWKRETFWVLVQWLKCIKGQTERETDRLTDR